jgi:hypothetical protein
MIAKEYVASVLRVQNKPSKRQARIDLGHCIQIQNTSVLSIRWRYTDHTTCLGPPAYRLVTILNWKTGSHIHTYHPQY